MDGVLVRFRIANGHKLVEHAFCQGLVHVFRDWNGGTEASKVAKILLHFPVEQNCAVDRYLHLFFFKLAHFFLAHLLAKRWKSPACKENYQQRTNNQSRMDLAITVCQTTSTIRDLADGRLGQHYPRPRRWTLGQHYPRPRRWTLGHYPRPRRWTPTQGMEDTRMKGHAWQLTLSRMRRSK